MNEFKKRNRVELPTGGKRQLQKSSEEKYKTNFFTEEEKKKSEIINLIIAVLNGRQLTKEQEEKLLETDEKQLTSIQYILWCMAEERVKTGTITKENFEKYTTGERKRISLGQAIGEEWEKEPEK